MKNILITGSTGFIGLNLVNVLNKLNDISIIHHGSKNSIKDLKFALKKCDIIYISEHT